MAMVNMMDKFVLSRWRLKPIVLLLILGLTGLVPAPVILIARGFSPLSWKIVLITGAAGLFYVLMSALYFLAAKSEEISRVVPLFYLSPLFVSVLAWAFLGERLGAGEYAGILFLMAGAILINSRPGVLFRPGKAFRLMILAAFVLALYMTAVKQALKGSDFWTAFALVRLWTFILLIPWLIRRRSDLKSAVRDHGPKVIGIMSANEIFALAATLCSVAAVSLGPVTLVTALSSLQPFFVLVFALLLSRFLPGVLKEETGRSTVLLKLASIALMFAGAVLIT
jgi:drug/metabolite transporter (DMT)-like permease